MKMTDTVSISAPPDTVWAGLNDPEVLRTCIPGCESLEKTSDESFEAKAGLKIGPLKASFKGKVTLSDLDPPNSYRITGEGTGGAAGFAKGSALVTLKPTATGTDLVYEVDATVGGKLAQIGQRFIDQTAKKLSDDFFKAFSEKMTAVSAGLSNTVEGNPSVGDVTAAGTHSAPKKSLEGSSASPPKTEAADTKLGESPATSEPPPVAPSENRKEMTAASPTLTDIPSADSSRKLSALQKLTLVGLGIAFALIGLGIFWIATGN